MDEEQFKGSWQQFKGEVKNKWGRLTDKDLLESYKKNMAVEMRK